MDGRQVHHVQGIELIPVQVRLDEHKVRQVLDIDIGRGLREQFGRLLVQLGLLRVVGGGIGLSMIASYSGLS